MDCPECKKITNHIYLHNAAHGIPGTHMVGSERYECIECGYKMFKQEGIEKGLEFFLD